MNESPFKNRMSSLELNYYKKRSCRFYSGSVFYNSYLVVNKLTEPHGMFCILSAIDAYRLRSWRIEWDIACREFRFFFHLLLANVTSAPPRKNPSRDISALLLIVRVNRHVYGNAFHGMHVLCSISVFASCLKRKLYSLYNNPILRTKVLPHEEERNPTIKRYDETWHT